MSSEAEALRAVAQVVARALDDLDVVAHSPVQGMAMHRVIAARLLAELPAEGFTIEPRR